MYGFLRGILAILFIGIFNTGGFAMAQSSSPVKTVVLVHGAVANG